MRAAVLHGTEDVRIEAVPVPVPGPGEVLLRTEVALTCGTDVKVYRRGYHARMIVPPALFGHEVAGVVQAVGEGVGERVRPGMAVVAANSAPCSTCRACRRGSPNLCDDLLFWNGAYAEFVLIPARVVQRNLLPLPEGLSFRDAALVEPLACAVRGIEDSGVAPEQWVAVLGTGPIALMLVALARLEGARVIAVGRRTEALATAQAAGAERTLLFGGVEEIPEGLRREIPGGPDVVLEAIGRIETCDAAVQAVGKGGLVNLFAGCPAGLSLGIDAQRLHYDELTVKSTFHHTPRSVRQALRLIAEGRVTPGTFVEAEAPLEELPRILARLAQGRGGLKTAILPWAKS
jgi:L-iditol 2-dehydrogenase